MAHLILMPSTCVTLTLSPLITRTLTLTPFDLTMTPFDLAASLTRVIAHPNGLLVYLY
jgi:hypothetical protein